MAARKLRRFVLKTASGAISGATFGHSNLAPKNYSENRPPLVSTCSSRHVFTLFGFAALFIKTDNCAQTDLLFMTSQYLIFSSFWIHFSDIDILFFRLFDIFKPGPVQIMDDMDDSIGVMMDDVVAGILACLVTQSILYFY